MLIKEVRPSVCWTAAVGRRPFRQRTLADSMDWSHRLLGDDERILLRRLAPFQQFGVESVRALAEGTGRLPR